METSKRHVTIIDELWDNQQSKTVGKNLFNTGFIFLNIRIDDCMMNKNDHYKGKILN